MRVSDEGRPLSITVCERLSYPRVIVGFSIPASSTTCLMFVSREVGIETVDPVPGCSGIARLAAVGYYLR